MEISDELLDRVADLLSAVYRKVNWRRMGRRNPHDVFQHRIKFAANKATVYEFLDKLCHGLGLQSIKYDHEKIEALEAQRDKVLFALRRESVYLVAKATYLAQQYKKRMREIKKKEKEMNEKLEVLKDEG